MAVRHARNLVPLRGNQVAPPRRTWFSTRSGETRFGRYGSPETATANALRTLTI